MWPDSSSVKAVNFVKKIFYSNWDNEFFQRDCFLLAHPVYDPMCIPYVEFRELSEDLIRTRGNIYKVIQHHSHYDLRKFNFTNRLIPIWNSLSDCVVSAETVNTFKNWLYRFCSNQEVLYDYRADLHGIRNRTIVMYLPVFYVIYVVYWMYFSDREAFGGLSSMWWCDDAVEMLLCYQQLLNT